MLVVPAPLAISEGVAEDITPTPSGKEIEGVGGEGEHDDSSERALASLAILPVLILCKEDFPPRAPDWTIEEAGEEEDEEGKGEDTWPYEELSGQEEGESSREKVSAQQGEARNQEETSAQLVLSSSSPTSATVKVVTNPTVKASVVLAASLALDVPTITPAVLAAHAPSVVLSSASAPSESTLSPTAHFRKRATERGITNFQEALGDSIRFALEDSCPFKECKSTIEYQMGFLIKELGMSGSALYFRRMEWVESAIKRLLALRAKGSNITILAIGEAQAAVNE
ncbi:uncharacterized protein LOC109844908 [Asparagus officinalis]|uniref:uncharacterized protein LOC109844908 n=1 Tax=Asparagus officinalis TaxID=4686 RepID=UPI00098E464C|nr:uncharacterized protein LOC109844908 [Asparagus officinalis]